MPHDRTPTHKPLAAETAVEPPWSEPAKGVSAGFLRLLVVFHESESLGAGTAVLRALPALASYGWTVSAWFPGEGTLVEASSALAEHHVVARPLASSLAGWRATPGLLARVSQTPAYLRDLRNVLELTRPTVVHANTLLTLPEALVARSCGLPLVVYVHEIPASGIKRAAALRLACNAADVVVAVSNAVAAMLRPAAGRTPVQTVHNGTPVLDTTISRSGLFTVGTVGTVSRVKGTDVFIQAAQMALAQRPDMRFEHVGSPHLHRDPVFRRELEALSAGSGVEQRVAMLGVQPAADAIKRWDLFILSSRSEGFPLAILEAMAIGLPIVATAVGGVPEQIEHLRTGILVHPDDPEALAAWIVRLRDDDDLRTRLGAAAREHVRETFTISRQATGMHRAYLTALNRRFGPPPVRRNAGREP